MKNAIILCSGGIDSVTASYYVKKKLRYNDIKIIFFNYGQRNLSVEESSSRNCAKELSANFVKINLPYLNKISTSLINTNKKPQRLNKKDLKNTKKESEKYYVPCRNTIFLIYALTLAESFYIKTRKQYDIFVGFKHEGQEFYPDTTPNFVKQMNSLAKLTCKKPFKIKAPLIWKDKEDIIKLATKLNINLKNTFSCYISNKKHCGICLSCQLRKQGFYWANVKDPTEYKSKN